jgi:hypothetical protein
LNLINPAWIPAGVTVVGIIANAVWSAVNLQMRADLAKQIEELKDWMRREYVPREMCQLCDGKKGASR